MQQKRCHLSDWRGGGTERDGARAAQPARGRDAHVAMRTGAVPGLSIGFEQTDDGATWKGNSVTRTKVRVREVSAATIAGFTTP